MCKYLLPQSRPHTQYTVAVPTYEQLLTTHSFQNKGVGNNLSLVAEVQRGSEGWMRCNERVFPGGGEPKEKKGGKQSRGFTE